MCVYVYALCCYFFAPESPSPQKARITSVGQIPFAAGTTNMEPRWPELLAGNDFIYIWLTNQRFIPSFTSRVVFVLIETRLDFRTPREV